MKLRTEVAHMHGAALVVDTGGAGNQKDDGIAEFQTETSRERAAIVNGFIQRARGLNGLAADVGRGNNLRKNFWLQGWLSYRVGACTPTSYCNEIAVRASVWAGQPAAWLRTLPEAAAELASTFRHPLVELHAQGPGSLPDRALG